MNKYHNGKIYTIRSHLTDKYYIGSTINKLYKRQWEHKKKYNRWLKNNNLYYLTSFEIYKYNDAYIELLEEFKCENKMELTKREGELIREFKNNIVNIVIPNRTKKEYYEDNKDKLIIQHKKNYDNNKEMQLIKKSEKFNCDCGSNQIRKGEKARHEKSKKHLEFISNKI